MNAAEFDEHVRRALEGLPADLRKAMSNVEIVVEEANEEEPDLYGLYDGIALTQRDSGYAGVLPDKISIYRRPLVEDFGHAGGVVHSIRHDRPPRKGTARRPSRRIGRVRSRVR